MVTSDHDTYLKNAMEPDNGYPHKELYAWHQTYEKNKSSEDSVFKWKNRYKSLSQNTQFYSTLAEIDNIIWGCKNVEEFKMKLDIALIPQEVSNFAICYVWMNPGRWFIYDFKPEYANEYDMSTNEVNAWKIIYALHEEILSKSLPMLEVEEFLKFKI